MMPNTDTDYKKLFSELIKKQILVLGPDITLAKVRNVIGITVDVNGDVQKIDGDPQSLLQNLINQFVELSGLIVKKTMESILTSYPGMAGIVVTGAFGGAGAPTVSQPAQTIPTASAESVPQAQNIQTPIMPASPELPLRQAEDEASQRGEQTSPAAPPNIVDMPVQGVTVLASETQKPSEPPTFSSNEMEDLNKALEELSKTPLSTESSAAQNPVAVSN